MWAGGRVRRGEGLGRVCVRGRWGRGGHACGDGACGRRALALARGGEAAWAEGDERCRLAARWLRAAVGAARVVAVL